MSSTLHKYLVYAAYGSLVFTGTMHFVIDVVSQRMRGVRPPSAETTLYYGLNSSFALGQVVLGVLGLWLALRAPELVRAAPFVLVSVIAAVAWLVIAVVFMEYVPPRVNAAVFGVLVIAAWIAGRE